MIVNALESVEIHCKSPEYENALEYLERYGFQILNIVYGTSYYESGLRIFAVKKSKNHNGRGIETALDRQPGVEFASLESAKLHSVHK